MLDTLSEAQKPSLNRICQLHATTIEGQRARARALLLWDQEFYPVTAALDPNADANDRLMAALVRDLMNSAG